LKYHATERVPVTRHT